MDQESRSLAHRRSISAQFLLMIDIVFEPVPTYSTPLGTRMLFAARAGSFEGPRMRGTVLPGSADWMTIGDDGVGRVDVRATLRTDEGDHIHMTNTGRVVLGEHRSRMFAGEQVTADEAYIRTHPLFETAAPQHARLNQLSTVGFCDISLHAIRYRIYALD